MIDPNKREFLRTIPAFLAAGAGGHSVLASAQQAQAFPWKPVAIHVTPGVGGVTSSACRLIASKLTGMWNQPVVVMDRPGGSGIIGTDFVAKQPPDGHNILATITGLVQNPAFRNDLPYNIWKDIAPISEMYIARLMWAVDAALPVQNLTELIALVKAAPGKYNFASYGKGLTAHLLMEKMNKDLGLTITHVPYAGTAAAVRAVLAGDAHFTMADLGSFRAHMASGKMRVIAATGSRRSPHAASTPTFTESGVLGFDTDNWAAWFATGGTPEATLVKIANDLKLVQAMPDVQTFYTQAGLEPQTQSPAEFRQIVKRDFDYWSSLAKSGIKID